MRYLLTILMLCVFTINTYAKIVNIKAKTPSSSAVKEFAIDEDTHKNNQQLIKLILNTESMDDKERQYWFDIMPNMTKEQVGRLFNILETERKKLEELDKKYQKEIDALNGKNVYDKLTTNTGDRDILVYKNPIDEQNHMFVPIKAREFKFDRMSIVNFREAKNLNLTDGLEKYILSTLDDEESYKFYTSTPLYQKLEHIKYLGDEYYRTKKLGRLKELTKRIEKYKNFNESSKYCFLYCSKYASILREMGTG